VSYVNFEIDLLRTFVLAVEAGNFVSAANAVGRTPSAVSIQMDRLEDLAGQKLFRRRGRSFVLTSAGEQLLAYARRMLALNDETANALRASASIQTIRLGVPEDFARCWLPSVLARFAHLAPGITVEVRTDVSSALLAALNKAELDLAVVFGNHDRAGAKSVATLPAVWVAAPEFRDYRPSGPVPLVLFSAPCVFRSTAIESLERAGLPWRIVLTSPGLSAQWGAVKGGVGISLRAQPFVPLDLITLGKDNGLPALPAAVLTLHQRPGLPAAAAALRDTLLESTATTV